MIHSFEIENFKCFKSLKVNNLARITLVAGRNNVGKTALLEALFLFFDRKPETQIIKQYGWRGLERVSTNPDGMWAPIFRGFDLTQSVSISVQLDENNHSATYRYYPKPKLDLLPRSKNEESYKSPEYSSEKGVRTDSESIQSASLEIEYYEGASLILTSRLLIGPDGRPLIVHDGPIPELSEKAFFRAAKVRLSSKEIANRYSKMKKAGEERCVLEVLKIIEPDLKEVMILTEGGEPVLHGDIGLGPRPISLLGGGMESLLRIIVTMGQMKNTVLFVDEIENGIFHSMLPKIWEALSNYAVHFNCQIIASTHSFECIEAAHQGLANRPEDLRFIRLGCENGSITANVSDYEMLSVAIQQGLEIR